MTHRDRQQSVPQPLPRSTSAGTSAAVAAANRPQGCVAPSATGATGTCFADIVITPKVSGKFLISWTVSGVCSAAAALMTMGYTVAGSTVTTMTAAAGGDAGHTAFASQYVVASGFTLGTPVTFNVHWSASTGTFAPNAGQGTLVVQELAA